MRKIAILAALAAFATTAQAQRGGPPDGRGRMGGRGGPGFGIEQMLLKDITLTDAQKTALEDLHTAERAKMQEGRGQGRGNFEAMRAAREAGDTATMRRLMEEQRKQMEARRDEQIASIRALLTGDQLVTFDNNVTDMKKREAEMGPRAPGGRGRGRGGPPPQR